MSLSKEAILYQKDSYFEGKLLNYLIWLILTAENSPTFLNTFFFPF